MSVTVSPALEKPGSAPQSQRRRFRQEPVPVRNALTEAPVLQPTPGQLGPWLPITTLQQLALQTPAADVRQRKLTWAMFFWLTVLAFGLGGPATLHHLLSYVVVAALLAGLSGVQAHLSKEAVSENFRERP